MVKTVWDRFDFVARGGGSLFFDIEQRLGQAC